MKVWHFGGMILTMALLQIKTLFSQRRGGDNWPWKQSLPMWINGGTTGLNLDMWKLFSPTNSYINWCNLSGPCSVAAAPLLPNIHTRSPSLFMVIR